MTIVSKAKTPEEFRQDILELLDQRIAVERSWVILGKTKAKKAQLESAIRLLADFGDTIRKVEILP